MDNIAKPAEIPLIHQKIAVKASMLGSILIPFPKSFQLAYYNEVAYLESSNNVTGMYLYNYKCHTLCRTLKSYEEELPPDIFFRCDKSFLVNLYFIREIFFKPGQITLINGVTIPVSRRKLPDLFNMLKNRPHAIPSVINTDN